MTDSSDLTDRQLRMVQDSGEHRASHDGYGVELRGGSWTTARSLVAHGLGWIQGDPGGEIAALYFNNAEGVQILHEFDDEDDSE